MRAGSWVGCAVVLALVAASGCAPYLAGEAGAASPDGLYRAAAPVAASEGVYGDGSHASEVPAVERVAAPAPALQQEPAVFVVRTNRCCPGPVVVTVACADAAATREEAEAPPPAPYKPFPDPGRRAPSLYHDR